MSVRSVVVLAARKYARGIKNAGLVAVIPLAILLLMLVVHLCT